MGVRAPTGDTDAAASVLSQVAHDLRTPLGSLALWLHELREECTKAEVAGDSLPMVESAARALTRLAQDLDDAARILRGTLRLQTRPVELRALLERIRERMRSRAEVKGIDLRIALGSEPVLVSGDPERLDRLLDALVQGALAAASGGSVVEARLDVNSDEALVSITPRPVGPEGLPRLEEQLGLPAPGRGSPGLPLALARHLLDAHGAVVEVGTSDLRVRLALAKPS